MRQRELEVLGPDECRLLLAGAAVGRLVYVDAAGPAAVPVNYVLVDDAIVMRVEGGAKADATAQPTLGFEVDRIDADTRTAWSVLVRGPAEEVPLEEVAALLRRSGGAMPEPWAFGVHNVWLRLAIGSVTGRRLGAVKEQLVY